VPLLAEIMPGDDAWRRLPTDPTRPPKTTSASRTAGLVEASSEPGGFGPDLSAPLMRSIACLSMTAAGGDILENLGFTKLYYRS